MEIARFGAGVTEMKNPRSCLLEGKTVTGDMVDNLERHHRQVIETEFSVGMKTGEKSLTFQAWGQPELGQHIVTSEDRQCRCLTFRGA